MVSGDKQGARRVTNPYVWQFISAATLIALSVLLRLSGLYSDIAWLYDRDRLWLQPVPYIDYPNEYPVGIGLLSWAVSYVPGGKTAYFLVTAVLLLIAGLLVLRMGRSFPGARLWIFALSPALLWYAALNWDLVALGLLVAALLALRQSRDLVGGGLLAMAVWTKFFPLVVLPLVILDRLLQRRWRDVARLSCAFGTISVVMNAPFAIVAGREGLHLREGWLRFFTFNQDRPQEANLWELLSWVGVRPDTAAINQMSELFLLLGLVVTGGLLWFARRHTTEPPGESLLFATLLLLSWWFLVNKVYSPQYSLWMIVLLVIAGAPAWLAVGFMVADTAWFIAILFAVAERGWAGWMHAPLLLPPLALREVAILVLVVWAVYRLLQVGTHARSKRSGRALAKGYAPLGTLPVAK